MAEPAGTLIDTVLRRVRDPAGVLHSRDFVRSLLTRTQRAVNASREDVLTEVSYTVEPRRVIFPLAGDVQLGSSAVRIKSVRAGGRQLPRVDWTTLHGADARWFRAVEDDSPQYWDQIGADLFILWPASPIVQTVTITVVKLTNEFMSESTASELPDNRLPAVRDLAEKILLVRARLFRSLKEADSRLTEHLGHE